MDQFDRHRNIENDFFETADESGKGDVKGSIEVSESPLEKAVVSGTEPESAHKGARRFPRGTEQLEVATIAHASIDDEDGDDDEDDDELLPDGVPAISRKIRRRRRRTRPRSKTIAMKRLTREELRIGALLYPPVDVPRPQTREECHQQHRPCPWVACKHHLYLDVNPETGSIKINFPDLEPWEARGYLCARRCRTRRHHAGGSRRDHESHPRADSPGRGPRASQDPRLLADARGAGLAGDRRRRVAAARAAWSIRLRHVPRAPARARGHNIDIWFSRRPRARSRHRGGLLPGVVCVHPLAERHAALESR